MVSPSACDHARVRTIVGTAAALICVSVLAPAAAVAATPTQAQIRAAVRRAEGSPQLWATVNVCDQAKTKFGIRGQMPALGFPTRMSMQIQVNYWNPAKKRFVPDKGAVETVSLGRPARNLHQAGFVWHFQPQVTLSGSVTFQWKLGRKVIGETTRATKNGVKGVDDTDPKGNSTASCKLLGATAKP
jgi:hypothetical protein